MKCTQRVAVAVLGGLGVASAHALEAPGYREVVQESPSGAATDAEFEKFRTKFKARWGRKVVMDHEQFFLEPENSSLRFSPQPDLMFFLQYRWHENHGAAVAWHADLVDSAGREVGKFAVIAAADGSAVYLDAVVGNRSFKARSLGGQSRDLLLFEVGDVDLPYAHTHGPTKRLTEKEKAAYREYLRTDAGVQERRGLTEDYRRRIRAKKKAGIEAENPIDEHVD